MYASTTFQAVLSIRNRTKFEKKTSGYLATTLLVEDLLMS